MKELNWFQKFGIKYKLPFFGRWFEFTDKFPEIGQKVQVKSTDGLGLKPEKMYVSEVFKWVVTADKKKEWLEAGLSTKQWKVCN